MLPIYKHEMKFYLKTLLVWFVCTAALGAACILLFSNLKESMTDIAENFASMGSFSDAFGMSGLSIATLPGFYAAEIGTIHALGGAMFAAVIGTDLLSKEENGHTSEFLFTLPTTRRKVLSAKWCAAAGIIVLFNLLCMAVFFTCITIIGEEMDWKSFLMFHIMQTLMHLEIAAVCFCISAGINKIKSGLGIGIALLFYAFDLIARVLPDLSDLKWLSPFSYANAADIFQHTSTELKAVLAGTALGICCICISYAIYERKDLAV